jgi:hypothetical protein
MANFKLPSYNTFKWKKARVGSFELDESVETLETQVTFDSNNALQLLILRHLHMAEIPTGAIKVEVNSAVRKTYIRIFNLGVDEIKDLLTDEKIASKITIQDTSHDVEPEFMG